MPTSDQIYEGVPPHYRPEAVAQWGQAAIEQSEQHLQKMTKADFAQLKIGFQQLNEALATAMPLGATNAEVQQLIAQHYAYITQFWGKKPSPKAYVGLGDLYVNDERYTTQNGQPSPEFVKFMKAAMAVYAEIL